MAISPVLAGPLSAFLLVLSSPAEGEPPGSQDPDFDLDFNLFDDDIEVALPDPAIERSAGLRRGMLQAHQIAGLTTLGLMATTVVLGQLNYDDLFSETGAGTGKYSTPHHVAAYGTAGAFVITGGFSLLAPVPYEREGGFDAGTVHRIAAFGATAGLAGQVVLGILAGRAMRAGQADRLDRLGDLHQATGYLTLALLTTAAASWVF